ncbi:hypothetical protein K466DRAFT_581699 [Polyporus arcularius HHB13444]|uniref:Uncharacterized protein n=1 Tax=Polyporus arcularius HHB13444 TaxID=1314778 RepID=A0A5C3PTE7_9APHY|nr:hypothetical protein K466DRAFT_581699 [Polyporus arcularius HHB13444]
MHAAATPSISGNVGCTLLRTSSVHALFSHTLVRAPQVLSTPDLLQLVSDICGSRWIHRIPLTPTPGRTRHTTPVSTDLLSSGSCTLRALREFASTFSAFMHGPHYSGLLGLVHSSTSSLPRIDAATSSTVPRCAQLTHVVASSLQPPGQHRLPGKNPRSDHNGAR